MRLDLGFRTELDGISTWISKQFERTIGQILGWWGIEHRDDGTHGAVTATRLTVVGPVTINDPDKGGPTSGVNTVLDVRAARPQGVRVKVTGAGASLYLASTDPVSQPTEIFMVAGSNFLQFYVDSSLAQIIVPSATWPHFDITTAIRERGRSFAMGEWIAFTPTWTNLTVGNGTVTAKYTQVGDTVFFEVVVVFGSTTTIGGSVTMGNLPVNNVAGSIQSSGRALYYDSSLGATNTGSSQVASATSMILTVENVTGSYSNPNALAAAIPFVWATGDQIWFSGSYRAA